MCVSSLVEFLGFSMSHEKSLPQVLLPLQPGLQNEKASRPESKPQLGAKLS